MEQAKCINSNENTGILAQNTQVFMHNSKQTPVGTGNAKGE